MSAAQGQLGPDFHQRDEDNIDASREQAAATRSDRRWVKRRRPFWTECSLCEQRKAHTLGWHLIRLGWERVTQGRRG